MNILSRRLFVLFENFNFFHLLPRYKKVKTKNLRHQQSPPNKTSNIHTWYTSALLRAEKGQNMAQNHILHFTIDIYLTKHKIIWHTEVVLGCLEKLLNFEKLILSAAADMKGS